LDILISIAKIQEWMTIFGLALGSEIENIRDRGDLMSRIDPVPKYVPQNELGELGDRWRDEHKLAGMFHGALDPTHVGHSRLAMITYEYCDVLIVGFDSNEWLRHRKGLDRPRFPQLAWRMWELASMPTVDHVFVLPREVDNDEAFGKLYEKLGVRVLGCGGNNPLLPEFRRRMDRLGGVVIAEDANLTYSSTEMLGQIMQPGEATSLSLQGLQAMADKIDAKARAAGYLRDIISIES
jgi:hypothetical protein